MLKKIISAAMVLFTALALCACKDDEPAAQIEEKIWVGTYVYTNDETGEFKVLSVTDEDETGVSMTFESVRSSDEFTAPFKSSSGKYAVLNAGDRCLKFSLQSSNTVVRVDDMWTSDTRRNENWCGKYVMPSKREKPLTSSATKTGTASMSAPIRVWKSACGRSERALCSLPIQSLPRRKIRQSTSGAPLRKQ